MPRWVFWPLKNLVLSRKLPEFSWKTSFYSAHLLPYGTMYSDVQVGHDPWTAEQRRKSRLSLFSAQRYSLLSMDFHISHLILWAPASPPAWLSCCAPPDDQDVPEMLGELSGNYSGYLPSLITPSTQPSQESGDFSLFVSQLLLLKAMFADPWPLGRDHLNKNTVWRHMAQMNKARWFPQQPYA